MSYATHLVKQTFLTKFVSKGHFHDTTTSLVLVIYRQLTIEDMGRYIHDVDDFRVSSLRVCQLTILSVEVAVFSCQSIYSRMGPAGQESSQLKSSWQVVSFIVLVTSVTLTLVMCECWLAASPSYQPWMTLEQRSACWRFRAVVVCLHSLHDSLASTFYCL